MVLKTLEFQKHTHIPYSVTRAKYFSNGIITENPIQLTSDEIKSIISLFFCFKFHYPNFDDSKVPEIITILNERNLVFNITRDFGRHMIENLDNYYKGWLNHIEKTTFHFDKILKNTEIINFVEMALLDFMIIRNWEFGKFFIQEFSKIIIDSTTLERNSLSIKRALEKENDYLKKIGEKILESDENLETNESLLLVITLQERIIKNTVLRYSYTLTSYIVRENALELSLKIDTYKKTLSKSLNLKWSIDIDKGKGKGRGRGR
ncbi:MAG: hypothetical protein A3G95_07675 [Flavobacteria bacterium RIFCSPLOWO2_12_FULL_31_7]|nr:MAG: hypothetical protein A3G95_07675 [Flavobacteria bacterium RIFCSPLOWO2_12_FULL_31_7]